MQASYISSRIHVSACFAFICYVVALARARVLPPAFASSVVTDLRPLSAMATPAPCAPSAVAERVWSWEEVRRIAQAQAAAGHGGQLWRLNSHALKWIRHLGEDPAGVLRPDREVCVLSLDELLVIQDMVHDRSGPGFSFDAPAVAGKWLEWSPAQFLM